MASNIFQVGGDYKAPNVTTNRTTTTAKATPATVDPVSAAAITLAAVSATLTAGASGVSDY